LVIGEDVAATPTDAEAVQRGQHEVGRLPVLLRPARYHEVVVRRAAIPSGVEGACEQVAAVRLHGVPQPPAIAPPPPAKEGVRSDAALGQQSFSWFSAASKAS